MFKGLQTSIKNHDNYDHSTYLALKNGEEITSISKGVANVVRCKISIHLLLHEFHDFFASNTLNGIWDNWNKQSCKKKKEREINILIEIRINDAYLT